MDVNVNELMGFLAHHWISRVFLVALAVVFINFVLLRGLRRLGHAVNKSNTFWDDALFAAASLPLRVFTWVQGLAIAAGMVEPLPQDEVFALVGSVRKVAVIGVIVWFLLRLISEVTHQIAAQERREDSRYDDTTIEAMSKLLRLAVLITGVLVVLQTLGISVSGVLAFGGVGGIAIGFAAKDMLSNLFGGLTIYLDRPFAKGDWICSPEKDIEGTVENIGWRTTVIRRFNKRPITVPNAMFTNLVVENPSRMTHRRIYESVGIRYSDANKMQAITDDVRQYLKESPDIDTDQTVLVNFDRFGASSLDFFIYCLTRTTNWAEYHRVKHAVLLQVMEIVTAHGAECAFPTRTLEFSDPAMAARLAAVPQAEGSAADSAQIDAGATA